MERDEELLTAKEFRAILKLKESAFREKLRSGELPPESIPGRWRRGTVNEWVKALALVRAMTPGLLRPMDTHENRQKAAQTDEDRRKAADDDSGTSQPRKPR